MRRLLSRQKSKRSWTKQFSCLLLLVSCRGLIPIRTVSRFKVTTNGQTPFSSQPTTAAKVETLFLSTEDTTEDISNKIENSTIAEDPSTRPSMWASKAPKKWWKERVLLGDLKVGQELSGHVVQDYLEGKTGPKIYFECGVGTRDRDGNWTMVNGMLRLDRGKVSVAKKRTARFRKKDEVQLFVSRIQKECGRLEVCTKIENVEKYATAKPKLSVTTLKKNQEVIGRVARLNAYGAIIDIGANVKGLLHITKVARVMNRYIDKEKGLKAAGLEKGAKVRLVVESIEKRRLSLDFTDDVKEVALKEKADKNKPKSEEQQPTDQDNNFQSNDELEAWAEYANQETSNEKQDEGEVGSASIDQDEGEVGSASIDDEDDDNDDDEDEYEEDRYDEEMDIESSLGLDSW